MSVVANNNVLVAIMNKQRDFALLRESSWYRIPVTVAEKRLLRRWPPRWIAFYQTKVFGEEAHSVRYFAEVAGIEEVSRRQLFPDENLGDQNERRYFKITIRGLQQLQRPIFSRRWRRIIFIQTTWDKFVTASEINDLFDESPLEDRLWAEFKRHNILAERQEYVVAQGNNYALDFAIYCNRGKLDVETDGDLWHANPQAAAADNRRDNALSTAGWRVLRFNSGQIREEAAAYCISTVADNINNLEGLISDGIIPRPIITDNRGHQMLLWDDYQA